MQTVRCVHVVIAILISGAAPAPLWPAAPAGLAEKIRAIADQEIRSNSLVGVSIAVADGDEVLFAEGFGFADLEAKVPATADTVYRIGSITKQFTAAAILQLAEQEKLSLDDPLDDHLTEYSHEDPPVTIQHLLQHTSGIQSFTDLPSYRRLMRVDVTHDHIIGRFSGLPRHFKPGEDFRYCNSGYYLLGVILERAAGESYEQYLKAHVFTPAGLERTYYDRTARVIENRARGYRRVRSDFQNAAFLSMTQPFSAGALASTVTDLVQWQRALTSHRVLSADSFRRMTTPGLLASGKQIDYGMGLFLRESDGRRSIGHGGGINGFRSDLRYYPDNDHTIAVLANCENAKPGRISQRIAKLLGTPAATSNSRQANRSVSISSQERDQALIGLPDIVSFAASKSDRFLVDLEVVQSGHPYRGENAERPHTGGHVYFKLPDQPIPPQNVERFPAIYAVADGVISRIDYNFRLREMFEPALNRTVANYRYGIGLTFARSGRHAVDFHYSIEPFVDPGEGRFYEPFILVKTGQRVRQGEVIARMFLPANRQLARKSHIHFNLIGGENHRFMAPAIFSDDVVKRFHASWKRSNRSGDAHIPPCLGYQLAPAENPFGTGAKETL